MKEQRSMRGRFAPLLVLIALLAGCAAPRPTTPVQVKILAINDFHGNLKPPQGGIRITRPAGSEQDDQRAGRRRRAPGHRGRRVAREEPEPHLRRRGRPGRRHAAAVGAVPRRADDRGAGPDGAGGQRGRQPRVRQGRVPSCCACSAAAAIRPTAARGRSRSGGARFQYLAASIVDTRTGKPLLPAYHVKRFQGIPVAFIGLTLKDTPHHRRAGRRGRA